MRPDKLIPFDEELAHVEAYAALALSDENKGISIRYEIGETGFFLPPLTVQPIIENAILHGLRDVGDGHSFNRFGKWILGDHSNR